MLWSRNLSKRSLGMSIDVDRRRVVKAVTSVCAALAGGGSIPAQQNARPSTSAKRPAPLEAERVNQFVRAAHADLDGTREMLEREPRLVRAAWDWGGGDVETALGGASHMGRQDIATLLLDRGAPMDLFAAAMLGHLPIVRAALEARPSLLHVPGPHGIPLVEHARIGGSSATAVLGYLTDLLSAR
jgi:hypothetical protein